MIRAAKASVNDSQTPQAALHYQVADGCDLTRELEAAGLVGSFDKVFRYGAIRQQMSCIARKLPDADEFALPVSDTTIRSLATPR